MTMLRKHYKTVILAITISAAFAVLDLYIINLSSYLCGGLLAGMIYELKRKPEQKQGGEIVKESQKCPWCGGKLRNIAAKKPGGVEQKRCTGCHRKYDVVGGKMKQVAI
jgi:hypothetical protein